MKKDRLVKVKISDSNKLLIKRITILLKRDTIFKRKILLSPESKKPLKNSKKIIPRKIL